jgi:DUF971 family protein
VRWVATLLCRCAAEASNAAELLPTAPLGLRVNAATTACLLNMVRSRCERAVAIVVAVNAAVVGTGFTDIHDSLAFAWSYKHTYFH